MTRTLLVSRDSDRDFRITIPDDAKITFGPWSPPKGTERYTVGEKALGGTLRVYDGRGSGASVIAVFSGVTGYRDLSLDYEEKVVVEEGSTVWKNDATGYRREDKLRRKADWVDDTPPLLVPEEDVWSLPDQDS
jgi:hypothetical protein